MPTLSYAQDRLSYRWRKWGRRVAIAAASLVAVVLVSWIGRWVFIRAACLYWQARCADFEQPTLVTSDFTRVSAAADCWISYQNFLWRCGNLPPCTGSLSSPVYFLHGLVSPNGNHQVVAITATEDHHWIPNQSLSWATIDWTKITTPPTERHGLHSFNLRLTDSFEIRSATLDPADGSHFVLHGLQNLDLKPIDPATFFQLKSSDFQSSNRIIDGWLQDDGTIRFGPIK